MKTHNPIFLQAASSCGKTKSFIKLFTTIEDPMIGVIESLLGDRVVVKSTKNGELKTRTYTYDEAAYMHMTAEADPNTWIYLIGEIEDYELEESQIERVVVENMPLIDDFYCRNNPDLIELDLSKQSKMFYLDCKGNTSLTILDLSGLTNLVGIDCNNCPAIATIKYGASNSDVATAIADLITTNAALKGTVYTDSNGEFYSIIADAATAAGWTIAQL